MSMINIHHGMQLQLLDNDEDNATYFRYCARGEFRLQSCGRCELLRYPPMTACPWCSSTAAEWVPVQGEGTVHSYTEVHHSVQPGLAGKTPYTVLVVDLDTQCGQPTVFEALRIVGNLCNGAGELAGPDDVAKVGIGSRVKMSFTPISDEFALPQWVLLEPRPGDAAPWRCDTPI